LDVTTRRLSGFDIIGDVHGHCDALEALLKNMGYRIEGRSYRHPERTAVFVGDLIDRGPKVRETLELVKAMADAGTALVTLGNHEYNAVAYCTRGNDGEWLRPHTEKNTGQFKATLQAFEGDEDGWNVYLDWFRTLPLFLDLDCFRVVHACWSQRHIDLVGDRRLNDREFLLASARTGSPEYHAVETLLKGPEIALPPDSPFRDKEGNLRTETRVKWWRPLEGLTYQEASFPEQPTLSDEILDESAIDEHWDIYPDSAPPVFVGHYWLPPQTPQPFANVICLDYSVAKDGFLTAYRWDSGGEIRDDGFETVFPQV
jgi:hypothetical protein